jgi:uncharacterized DUF497 family protein
MADLRFQWDPQKSTANARKHGITFQEAETVFANEHALLIDDPEHSEREDRFVLLGLSARLRILVVGHTYRKQDEVIRLIWARKATRPERDRYNERWLA